MSAPAIDDVFQDDVPAIVDCDVLEAAKENIQPLASGRRATTLSAILSTPHSQRDARLASTRNRLRINVEVALEDEDDDPLDAYCQLVYWTVENYPQGHSAESGLLELLEEATRVLKDDRDGKWRNDLRYLKLWTLYASYVERPAIIYKFLMANEIGTDFALMYEEYALALERSGRRTEADEIYLLAIARQASPLDRLKNKHREFQKRMMVSAPAANPPPAAAPESSSRTRRAALATTSTSTPASEQGDVFSTAAAPTRAPPNARMQIFVDPTGSQSSSSETNPYPELGTRKSRVKENIPEVKKAAGTTIRAGSSRRTASGSSTSRSGGAPSRIMVFRDPEPGSEEATAAEAAEMPPPPVPVSKKKEKDKPAVPQTPSKSTGFSPFRDEPGGVPSTPSFTPFRDESAPTTPSHPRTPVSESVMRAKRAGEADVGPSSEAEALRKNPLKNYADVSGE
ncbi:hypothetical protein JAAARDRAFT_128265 [Jaapia argillacea MUCL 33604]|uniref:BUB1 N-terminal domain-containing protein n=1 Tax=Jaapia argillacea MUCL 33604 TaxID=933084 RepID=A0A067PXF7_9AGAM|nr:hypothetical protein JAAARDRAFT_128265 [Jaapia argillacea MUCL 33604]